MVSKQILQSSLENLVNFITPLLPLVNSHMVSFITEKHYENYIPPNIQTEITRTPNYDEILNVFWRNTSSDIKYPEITGYLNGLENLLNLNLKNISIDLEQLNEELGMLGFSKEDKKPLEINEFMTAKKKHEVEITSEIVVRLCSHPERRNLFIIDAGDGKGYLSSRLALEFNLRVLGIDANNMNSLNAEKRVTRMSKAWNGLTRRANDLSQGIQPPRRGKRKKSPDQNEFVTKMDINYKTSTEFITSKTDLCSLVASSFPDVAVEKILLSGLHTCGNLASDCLKIFVENTQVDVLLNIGCCYHLLTEQFIQDKFFKDRHGGKISDESPIPRFPLSEYLKHKEFCLGRNARMLASQSIHRTNLSRETPNKSLLYRALLEVMITEVNPSNSNIIQVGKIKCDSFVDYTRKCMVKHDLKLNNSDETLIQMEEKYREYSNLLNVFYLFRMNLAPILEAIILLDRVLYLKENRVPNVFLVRLFDPVVSPRCYGIVGIKES